MNLPLRFRQRVTPLLLRTRSSLRWSHQLLPQESYECRLLIRELSATNPRKALSLFPKLDDWKISDDPFVYASLIKACGKANANLEGKSIHCHVIRLGLDRNVNVLNSLVSVYMGSVDLICYASVLFGSVKEKTVVTVNCMISGYLRRGDFVMGFSLFNEMLSSGFGSDLKPNFVTFVILISGCVEYRECRRSWLPLHCCCFKMGLDCNTEVCNALINSYVKFGCVSDAMTLFREAPHKDLISWNAMIWGYVKSYDFTKAFQLFRNMRIAGFGTDKVSLSCLLSACATCGDLHRGEMLHAYARVLGLENEDSIGTGLITMYAKCKQVESGKKLFDEIPKRNIELWNAMVHGYIENGQATDALKLMDRIKWTELPLDEVTILGLIMACRDIGDLSRCTLVHFSVESNEHFRRSLILKNALIDLYAKCGCITKATSIFDTMPEKDVVSWTSMIVGHAINGDGRKALAMFHEMCENNLVPNSVTFVGVLLACDHTGMVIEGRKLYDTMRVDYGIEPRIEHCGCLVDMLARSGMIKEAETFVREMAVEPNALIWRMLLNGCRVHGHLNHGFNMINALLERKDARDSEDFVLSSNVQAEAGRWGDAVSSQNLAVFRKRAGRSSVLIIQ